MRLKRTSAEKQAGAFEARLEEGEVLARLIHQRHGLPLDLARRLALAASPLADLLPRRGQPPVNHELYAAVESIRAANGGKLPTQRGGAFWLTFTRQWNAAHREQPERQFWTRAGEPDWRSLQAAYQMARKRLERLADNLVAQHR